jgi:hypothetical protein
MFLSCNLSIALIDVPCKSSHRIIWLMLSVGVCHLDSNDCASEQEHRTRGGREDERMRGRQEMDRMGAEVSSVQRSGGLCGARPALPQGGWS